MYLCVAAAAGCGDGAAASGDGGPDATSVDAMGDARSDARDGASGTDGQAGEDARVPSDGGAACELPPLPALATEPIAPGASFTAPVFVTHAPGDDDSLYVVEQPGRIRIVRDGAVLAEPFLDISDGVRFFQERGLLGLAFHPDYAANGRFFVYYTPASEMRNVVAEYARSADDPDRAAEDEVRRLLRPQDPDSNHNGGMLAFGPDGRLYVGMGDGGGGCDRHPPNGNAQDLDSPFGKLHRLDVDAAERDFAASGNPFVEAAGLDTIWAYGLRNPWRFSFDRETGDLYIGDVGQDQFEEINFQPASSGGGENYGWRDFEGEVSSTASGCEPTGLVEDHVPPILAIPHGIDRTVVRQAQSVAGGYVYRGQAIPALRGAYLYGDFGSRDVGAFRYCAAEDRLVGHQRLSGLTGAGRGLASFGQDSRGELYLVYVESGEVLRIVPAP